MGNHSRDEDTTAEVPEPGAAAETTVPTGPQDAAAVPPADAPADPRYKRFLLVMNIPLGIHYGDWDIKDRYSRVASTVDQAILNEFAQSADTRILSLDPMNWDTCPGETLTTAVFGVFFNDVRLSSLTKYAEFLRSIKTKDLVKSGDAFLPATEVTVPSVAEWEALRVRLNTKKAQVDKFRAGGYSTGPQPPKTGVPAVPVTPTGSATPEKSQADVENFNEWDAF